MIQPPTLRPVEPCTPSPEGERAPALTTGPKMIRPRVAVPPMLMEVRVSSTLTAAPTDSPSAPTAEMMPVMPAPMAQPVSAATVADVASPASVAPLSAAAGCSSNPSPGDFSSATSGGAVRGGGAGLGDGADFGGGAVSATAAPG